MKALLGGVVGAVLGVVVGWRSHVATVPAWIAFVGISALCGLFAGAILAAVDRYQDRTDAARRAGRPAPSNLRMMLVYAAWCTGVLVAIIAACFAWLLWISR